MFNNKKEVSVPSATVVKNAAPSLLSSDLVINGNLESAGDMQVDGTVEGDIKSNKLTISASAVVRGSVEAESLVIAGNVTGQIKARHVTLNKSARVVADVIQERLTIEPGAFFEGNCRHFPGEEETLPRRIEPLATGKPNGAAASKASAKTEAGASDAA
ncbi:MAG: polymer-forming cytoskeletal protein [Alphaproteobacteria bacterium]|jgi:cytoskeletal protein CcmA (bactofilin family)|nr:polymer-forming cytoskeletal protein [Alphaproteobacteria bacterium]